MSQHEPPEQPGSSATRKEGLADAPFSGPMPLSAYGPDDPRSRPTRLIPLSELDPDSELYKQYMEERRAMFEELDRRNAPKPTRTTIERIPNSPTTSQMLISVFREQVEQFLLDRDEWSQEWSTPAKRPAAWEYAVITATQSTEKPTREIVRYTTYGTPDGRRLRYHHDVVWRISHPPITFTLSDKSGDAIIAQASCSVEHVARRMHTGSSEQLTGWGDDDNEEVKFKGFPKTATVSTDLLAVICLNTFGAAGWENYSVKEERKLSPDGEDAHVISTRYLLRRQRRND